MVQTPVLFDVVQGAFGRLVNISKEMVWIRVSCHELPRNEFVKKFYAN